MRIEELSLLTTDLAAQRAFYCDTWGLREVPAEADTLALEVGRSRLLFRQAAADWQGFYHMAFLIPENQLAAAKAWLAPHTPLLTTPEGADQIHFEHWNADSVYFLDPAGNILEFIARHGLDNGSDTPFSVASIIAVNEIGVVSADVLQTVALLGRDYGIASYIAPPDENFTAVGDGDGLLIVNKPGRRWLPDLTRISQPAPLRVRLRTALGVGVYEI